MNKSLIDIITQFSSKQILVIGDAMLDVYLTGYTQRLCREAPVPIVDIKKQTYVPGGGGNAACNIASFGAKCSFLSVIGNDQEGKILNRILKNQKIDTKHLLVSKQRKTLTKQRVIANSHMFVRFDYGTTQTISEKEEQTFINTLLNLYSTVDGIIISDYGYGIVTENIIRVLEKLQEKFQKILVVDAKYPDRYKTIGATVIKPNYQEIASFIVKSQEITVGKRIPYLEEHKDEILKATNATITAVTVDIEGSIIFTRNELSYRTYTKPITDLQAAGAGDTYTSAFALSLASSQDIQKAAEIAQGASLVVIKKEGTATCTQDELQHFFLRQKKQVENIYHLLTLIKQYKKAGKRIVYTNGCFDILHSGHVNYLNQAKNLGDILVVGLNTDKSIKQIKGTTRPINTLFERIEVLSGLSSIDYIIPFSQNTSIQLIKKIKPHVYVKGGDYTRETLPETQIVEQYGGSIEIIPFVKDRSTTNVIQKITKVYGNYGNLEQL